jgi:nucleoside-diphosphate-sugar epimerase
MAETVLVLGANGRCGRAVALAFAAAGWQVHAQTRRPWLGADAGGRLRPVLLGVDRADELAHASRGATVVVHALNPLYTRWEREVLPLADAAIEVSARLGATLMLPGNVYNFGDPIPPRLGESTPWNPNHVKARLRCELEQRLVARRDLRTVVVRAGDFFGAGRGTWFDQLMVKDLARGKIVYPGPLDVVHAWAYLPDLAATFVALAERRALLAAHDTVHFPGHSLTGRELVAALAGAARRLGITAAEPRLASFPWPLVRVAGVVMPMLRELARMSYLWRQPHVLDGAHLTALLGTVPATPLGSAVAAALADLFPGAESARARGAIATAR